MFCVHSCVSLFTSVEQNGLLNTLLFDKENIRSYWGSPSVNVLYHLWVFRTDTTCPVLLLLHAAVAYLLFCYDEVSSVSYDQFYSIYVGRLQFSDLEKTKRAIFVILYVLQRGKIVFNMWLIKNQKWFLRFSLNFWKMWCTLEERTNSTIKREYISREYNSLTDKV